ncbi:MAG: HD domain-containing protein [Parcubacteria group bacterium]|jgi:putative nucleotidyltransferase with HDIG domain
MNFSKEIYQKIWDAALPYQDKRDDAGHAEIVTNFALKLCKIEDVNEEIVIPAAILHDIGWSQLSDKERFVIFYKKATKEEMLHIRLRHQEEGVKLAKKILEDVGYTSGSIRKIVEIISEHDTRKVFLSKEDGIMRDADKLWCFSKLGLGADHRRRKEGFSSYFKQLKENIDNRSFFFSESARKIARKEIEINKKGLGF